MGSKTTTKPWGEIQASCRPLKRGLLKNPHRIHKAKLQTIQQREIHSLKNAHFINGDIIIALPCNSFLRTFCLVLVWFMFGCLMFRILAKYCWNFLMENTCQLMVSNPHWFCWVIYFTFLFTAHYYNVFMYCCWSFLLTLGWNLLWAIIMLTYFSSKLQFIIIFFM